MESRPFQKMSRRTFFKGLIALGVVSTFAEARALPRMKPREALQHTSRMVALWAPPGQRIRITMFVGDIPDDAEVIKAGGLYILRFPCYPDDGTWSGAAQQCAEPGCSKAVEAFGKTYCAEHAYLTP